MKNICVIAMLAIGFCSISCKKVKDALDITRPFAISNDITLSKIDDVERNLPDSVVTISQPNIPNSLPDDFKKNNVNIDKIKSVTLDSVVFKIKAPVEQNFSFMKSIKLYIGSAGKGEKLVASRDDINKINPATNVLYLTVQDSNIAEYIKSNTYDIKIQMALVKTYTMDIMMSSDIKGKVVANPIQ